MLKRSLLIVSLICLVILSGCSLFSSEDPTILVIKNHADSDATITYVCITQYVGGGELRSMSPNALDDQTIAPGADSRLFFEIAPVTAEESELRVEIGYEVEEEPRVGTSISSETAFMTYEPNTKFKLVCQYTNDPEDITFTIRGEGAALVDLD